MTKQQLIDTLAQAEELLNGWQKQVLTDAYSWEVKRDENVGRVS